MGVVVVGSVALDSIKTATGSVTNILGGSGTYFSLAASLFTDVKLVAVVGDDFPEEHVALLNDHSVDTECLERIEGGKTFHWSGVYSADFTERTTLDTQLNVFEHFQPKITDSYKETQDLFLANIHPSLQLDVLDQMGKCRFVACDTMNCWIHGTPDALHDVLKRVDLLVINDEESHLLTGIRSVHLAAEKILDMGPKYLIIKRGEFGAVLFGEGRTFTLPAYPVNHVVDPTGAGDSFAGGMMGYITNSDTIDYETIKRSVVVGTLVASFSVENFSVNRLATLNMGELLERQEYFAEMTSWSKVDIEAAGRQD